MNTSILEIKDLEIYFPQNKFTAVKGISLAMKIIY